jgi:hypothetical protein
MKLRWDKLWELARGESKEESRELVRLRKRFKEGGADVAEVIELAQHLLKRFSAQCFPGPASIHTYWKRHVPSSKI